MPLNNENNNDCCKCTTPQYELTLNQQGPQGKTGPQGEPGFSPTIVVNTNTDRVYSLTINTIDGQIVTPNLKASVPGDGPAGYVLTKNTSTPYDMSFQAIPQATETQSGILQLATITDTQPDEEGEVDDTKAVTPDLLSTYVEQEINAASDNFVTISGSQEITGTKTFYNNVVTNGITSRNGGTGLLNFDVNYNRVTVGTNSSEFGDSLLLRTNQEGSLQYQKGTVTTNILTDGDIATTSKAGIVKPDGTTITVDADGTIHSVGGTGGTEDYTELTNKPQINGVELTGNKTGTDLGLVSKSELSNYVDLTSEQTIPAIKIFQNGIFIDNIISPGEYGATQIGPNNISYRSINPEYQFFQLRPDQDNSYDLRIGNTTSKWNSVNINTNGLYLNGQPILNGTNLSDYLVAGNNITLDTDDEGKVTINSTGGGELPSNVLTSDNISQDAYIQQLEARIAALEALIDGGTSAND